MGLMVSELAPEQTHFCPPGHSSVTTVEARASQWRSAETDPRQNLWEGSQVQRGSGSWGGGAGRPWQQSLQSSRGGLRQERGLLVPREELTSF